MLVGEVERMTRITVRRVLNIAAIAVVIALVFSLLGWAMMPQWSTRPYSDHIAVSSPDPAIAPAHADIPHEGGYRTRETKLSIEVDDGVTLPAILREPIDAPGSRPACLFIHGSGTSGAEDFGDIANAMASAGIVTLVPAKRNDNYTVLHRDYQRFAREYSSSLDVLRSTAGVDPAKTGIYAESEGTWISTILASKRQDIAFAVLTSAPVFKGREQMAMAVSAYMHEAGAPAPVVKDTAKLMSLNYAPFDLAYADFDADHYLRSLTMPLLVNYGAYDTAMPIEQGAQRIIDAARSAGNENVTVRYFVGNHQMRAGKGLFTLNLPLAQGYTQALENWVNGIAAGAQADGWATPQIAGVHPHQQFAAPQQTKSGIIGSLGVLAGIMIAGPVLMLIAVILGIAMDIVDWLRMRGALGRRVPGRNMPAGWNQPYRRDAGTHVDDDGNRHRRRNAIVVDGNRLYTLRDRRAMHANPVLAWRAMPRGVAGPIAGLGVAIMVITVLLYGYMGAVGVAAVYVMPHPRLFGIGWRVLQALTVVLVLLFAVVAERLWRHRADIMGARRAAGIIMVVAALATCTTLAFWGLFSL